jgi:tRNA A-37 threonylcarbamoyl transferase component Bud32
MANAYRLEIQSKLNENIRVWKMIQEVESMSWSDPKYESAVESLEEYKADYDIRNDKLIDDIEEEGDDLFPRVTIIDNVKHEFGKFEGEEVPLGDADDIEDDVVLYKFEEDGHTYYLDRSFLEYDNTAAELAEIDAIYNVMEEEMDTVNDLLSTENELITPPLIGVLEFRKSRRPNLRFPFEIEQRFVYDAEDLGISLQEYLVAKNTKAALTADDYKSIYCKILPQLLKLHLSGVIHGNLRARNIFVKHDADFNITSVKFIDFRHGRESEVAADRVNDYVSVWSRALVQAGDFPTAAECFPKMKKFMQNKAWDRRRHAIAGYEAGTTRRRRNHRKRRATTRRRSTKK